MSEHATHLPFFDRVCNSEDWKAPIDAIVDEHEVDAVCDAIMFFTATIPTCINLGAGRWQVTSEGYRNGTIRFVPAGP